MENKSKKWILMTGILCMMALSVYGCGKGQENIGETAPGNNVEDESPDSDWESEKKADEAMPETDGTDEHTNADASKPGMQAQDTEDKEEVGGTEGKPSGDSTAASWDNSTPNLEGHIKEINGIQIIVIEAYQEKEESGAEIMVTPAVDGDDSGFNKVTVTYNEETLFSMKTIYGGGTSYETAEAAASDLEKGQSLQVWGSTQDGELKAEHIRIVQVK